MHDYLAGPGELRLGPARPYARARDRRQLRRHGHRAHPRPVFDLDAHGTHVAGIAAGARPLRREGIRRGGAGRAAPRPQDLARRAGQRLDHRRHGPRDGLRHPLRRGAADAAGDEPQLRRRQRAGGQGPDRPPGGLGAGGAPRRVAHDQRRQRWPRAEHDRTPRLGGSRHHRRRHAAVGIPAAGSRGSGAGSRRVLQRPRRGSRQARPGHPRDGVQLGAPVERRRRGEAGHQHGLAARGGPGGVPGLGAGAGDSGRWMPRGSSAR